MVATREIVKDAIDHGYDAYVVINGEYYECGIQASPVSDDSRTEFVGQLIDAFEDFLESKGISIDNPEKEDSDNPAILYGTDYGQIQDELEDTLVKWGIIDPR